MKTKKSFPKRLLAVGIVFFFQTLLIAAPIRNYPTTITQPDGQVINCFVSGDEFYHWLHDENGYTIIRNESDSWYYYAVVENDSLVPSEFKVGKVNPITTNLETGARVSPSKILEQQNLKSGGQKATQETNIKNKGTFNNIAIFVRFADEPEFGDSISIYENIFNDSTSSSVSLYAYYKECSYNSLFIKTHMYPKAVDGMVVSYKDIKPRGYYIRKTSENPDGYTSNQESRLAELNYRAIKAIEQEVPKDLNLDFNNDGRIDNITFIIRGDNDPEWSSILWGTSYNYTITANSPSIKINNKTVSSCIKVLQLQIKNGWGVMHHEMFHNLGAPDLYHYSFDNFFPIGVWDIMEAIANPAQSMTTYMKFKYGGWIDSIPTITKPGRYSLASIASKTHNCFKINSPNSANYYFALEYRKRMGAFESGIPGDGLLVYRVKKNSYGGNANASNFTDELYVFRPGGTTMNNGVITSAYLNKNKGRELINDNTSTACFLPGDKPGGIDIYDIKEDGDSLSFYVRFEKTPKASFEVSTQFSDNGKVRFFDNSSQSPDSWLWDFGDGESSAERDPIHYYTMNDTFDICLIVKNQFGSDTLTKNELIIIDRPQSVINEPIDTLCDSGTTNLVANSSESGTIVWYNDRFSGNILATGTPYYTEILDSTTTFYSALEVSKDTSYFVGAKDTTIGPCSTYSPSNWAFDDLYFDCLCDVILKSVKVFSISDKERRIKIINQKNEIIYDSLVNIPIGEYRLTLNANVEAGKNYKIIVASESPDLYYNGRGGKYPYEIPGIVSLTGNFFGTKEYGFFYDCEFQQANSSGPRTPITVEVIKAKINPRPEATICEGTTIELTSTPASTYLWHPNGETTQSITAVDSGNYTVSTLIGDCENTSLPVFINYFAKNPQIPIDTSINELKVTFKTKAVKGFHYHFDYGDGKTKEYDLPTTSPKDTAVLSFYHTYPQFGIYTFWQKITGVCVTDSISFNIDLKNPISIAENRTTNTLVLYPNPTSNSIQFTSPTSFSKSGQLKVFDYTGRQILTQTLPAKQQGETVTIDLSNQPAGIYLVRIKLGGKEFSGKVLLVK